MSNRKSLLAHSVKEAIINASEKGEDVLIKVGEITEYAVQRAIERGQGIFFQKKQQFNKREYQ
jgi:hypothetical protein